MMAPNKLTSVSVEVRDKARMLSMLADYEKSVGKRVGFSRFIKVLLDCWEKDKAL